MLDTHPAASTRPAGETEQKSQEQIAVDLVQSLTWIEAPDIPDAGDLPVQRGFAALAEGFCDTPIFEHFQKIAATCSSSVAIHDGTPRMTYGQLLSRSRMLARRITARVPPGEAVGIFSG